MDNGSPTQATSTPRHHRLVLIAATAGMGLAALDIDLPSAALPKIAAELQGMTLLGAVFTLYLVSSVFGMLLFGRLSDCHGRKPLFLAGIVIFMLGCILAASASRMWFFLCCRAIQGLGAGALPPLAMAIAADLVSDEGLLGRTQAIMNSVWGISGALGPLVGGTITDSLSWRGIFLFILPVAAGAMGMMAFSFQEQRPTRLIPRAGPAQPISSEKGGWRGWREPPVLSGYFASLLFGAVILLVFAYVPLFIQGIGWAGARVSGIVLAALSISWTGSGIAAGVFMQRAAAAPPVGRLISIGALLMLAAWLGLLALLQQGTPVAALVPAVLLLGCGGGLFNTPSIVVVPRLAPPRQRGLANALIEAAYSVGGAVGVFAAGLLFQFRMGPGADAISDHLLSSPGRTLLTSQQTGTLTSQLVSSLHGVYVLACSLAGLLVCAALVLSIAYAKKRLAPGSDTAPRAVS